MDPVFHLVGLGVFFRCVKWITWLQVPSEHVVFKFLQFMLLLHYYYYYYYFTVRVRPRNFRKSYLLLLAKTLRLLDVLLLLTMCAKTAISLGDTLFVFKNLR
jgi:hypothetical protein